MVKRRVCILTGTRAEWGLLSPIAAALKAREDVELQIVATNMHLDPRYGHTVDQIEAAGLRVNERVKMATDNPTGAAAARAMGQCISGMADALERLQPDLAVILGDRYEMLAAASACTVMRIPIAHLHGGELTIGAMDDAIRHAITKMAALHLTSTETHRQRVIQMGEQPDMVINTGAIGVYNTLNIPRVSREELESDLGIEVDNRTLLVTYHPATMDQRPATDLFDNLLEAIDRHPDSKVIFTYPNNDPSGAGLIEMIERYAAANPQRVRAVASLGARRYLSLLPLIGAAVGNSSSGLIEVPSAGIPTVNIGIRQQGRTSAPSVIDCGDTADEISAAIDRALSGEMRTIASRRENPYYQPDTLKLIVEAIAETPTERLRNKQFFDIK